MMYNIVNTIVKYLIPITNFLLALFAFYFTFSKFRNEKANITLRYTNIIRETLVDRESDSLPDVYWQDKYRLIVPIVITNNSSKPISIYSFFINNTYEFNMYTKVGGDYTTTTKTNISKSKGITHISNSPVNQTKDFLDHKNTLIPVFTLDAYGSRAGVLMFHYDSSLRKDNKLIVKTSRKDFTFDIGIEKWITSVIQTDYERPQLD
ncbi:hypothetical protein LABALGNA3A7_01820 [Dellaglioa algida]|nr:hypothetical protein LABALGNA3A7_01820 [Dellaglioa algida]